MGKLTFAVNNGRKLVLNQAERKIFVERYDDNNNLESCNSFSEGDIVMLINFINYMKENNQNTAYLKDCAGNYEDFRLLD